jgi:Fis family transcriptional regulator
MNNIDKQQLVGCDLAVENTESNAPLHQCVTDALDDYFKHLNGHSTTNLYEMLLTEVEVPLFKATLNYTNGNQSRAAEILGINRGTLRKKLKQYDL